MSGATGDWTAVEEVARTAEAAGGIIGVAASGPDGARFDRHGDRQFRAASTVKIPIMIELYRQIDRGERALTDQHVLEAEEKASGSGVLLHLHDGLALTLDDLIYLMISISDNTATNILIDLAGMDQVNATMRDIGMTGSTLGRKMKGRPAKEGEAENLATPADYVRVIQAILDGAAASAEGCAHMTRMLERQANPRRIARYLPPSEEEQKARGIRWGSKTGSIKGVTNDAGFITTERGTLILAVFCEDMPDHHLAEQAIGDISRACIAACGILPLDSPAAGR